MPRLEDFIADLERSRLVTRSEAELHLGSCTGLSQDEAPVALARALIREGILTPYQARKVLSGATKGFFLGGYRILQPLGEGGMGKVFLADRSGTTERVAIKVLPPKKAVEEKHSLLRFQREMDLSQRVTHPNLARTLGFGEEDGVHYMVMEYVPGRSLYDIVNGPKGRRFSVPEAARLFLKILDGLEAAHEAGIIHRDIKPSNIMVTPESDVRVLDLGLARAVGEEAPLTRPNIVVGTLDYVSPEQLINASQADARSDLYSLGCTLYFVLAGRPPFEGGDIVNKIFKQRMDEPEPLERVARNVPAEFAAIVRKLMAKVPGDRYQNCQELGQDLLRWATDVPGQENVRNSKDSTRSVALLDDDAPLLPNTGEGSPVVSLRDLGTAEPAPAPRKKTPAPPISAVIRTGTTGSRDGRETSPDDSRWLRHFIAIVLILGLLAILAIALFS